MLSSCKFTQRAGFVTLVFGGDNYQSVLLVMSTITAACESRARGRSEENGALEQPWYRS